MGCFVFVTELDRVLVVAFPRFQAIALSAYPIERHIVKTRVPLRSRQRIATLDDHSYKFQVRESLCQSVFSSLMAFRPHSAW